MKLKTLYILLLMPFMVFAQKVKPKEIDVEEFVQRMAPVTSEGADISQWMENLIMLYQDPLDINKATEADFRNLLLLKDAEISQILKHREQFGDYLSLYELQVISELDQRTISNLLPFLTIKSSIRDFKFREISRTASEQYLVLRAEQTLEQSKGFTDDKYAGSRQKYYSRFRMSHPKDFSIGFISEKDAGEKSMLDYYLFHLQIQNKGRLKNLVLGDFTSQFGQGMIFSAGFAPGKSSEPIYSTRRSNLGIKPYNSLVETGSMRGLAFTYSVKNLQISPMVGINKRDGTITEGQDDLELAFSAFSTTGLHRTQSEIDKRDNVREQNLGLNISYKKEHISLGFSGLETRYDKVAQRSDQAYNAFEFKGKKNLVMGPNVNINWQNFTFFGEAARSSSGGGGYILGWVSALGSKIEWATNFRNYQSNFHSFYGSAFSEGSRTINEKGIYNGLKYIPRKGIEFSAYYDAFKFPWLKYRVDAPSTGDDYQIRADFKPSKILRYYILFHHEQKQKNTSTPDVNIRYLVDATRSVTNIGGEYTYQKWLKIQSKIQYNTFKTEESTLKKGFAIIQDVEAKIKYNAIKGRIAYFKTDSYDNRVYAYENDVLYAVSFPAYYGRGMRYYLIGKFPINQNLDVWVRWANTRVYERENIGSGNDAVGNTRNDIKIQLKYSF
jgi:Helix-hairpin-helix motif